MADKFPKHVFTSLSELLSLEAFARGFSFQAKKQKVRSVLGGKHASKLRGRGMDFEEVRQYVAGDDIRNIDWKVTARTQKTHSKVFSEEKEKPALIVVDQSRTMFFGSQKKTKAVVAAEIASMAAFKIQKEGDRVGGLVFTETDVDVVLPKRNRKNTLRFLERIVESNHSLIHQKKGDREKILTEAMNKVQNIVTHDFLVIIISDFVHHSPEVIKYLARLAKHNDVVLIKVADPMERTLPTDKMIVGDGEKQIVVDGKKKSMQVQFEKAYDQDLSSFEAELLKYRIPLIQLNTTEDVDVQLKSVFR